ncbi:MAG: hypothetical protein AB7O80_01910 [Acetobacteraceae bacterium]
MADHGSSTFTGPETPEEFLAERQRLWNGFTHATTAAVVLSALTLILMAVFLI